MLSGHNTYLKKQNRPINFSECKYRQEPCPYVSCQFHLLWDYGPVYLDLRFANTSILTDEEIIAYLEEMPETCVLKVAEKARTLQYIGNVLKISRERVRQLAYWRTEFKGGLVELLKSDEFRKILKGYFGCQIRSSSSS